MESNVLFSVATVVAGPINSLAGGGGLTTFSRFWPWSSLRW
jgi:hypothetical protein